MNTMQDDAGDFRGMTPLPPLMISPAPRSPQQAIEMNALMNDIDRCTDMTQLKEITKGLLSQSVIYKNIIREMLTGLQ